MMTATGTVTIHVVDQKPVAQDDQYYFAATDTTVTVGANEGVQANDSDPDGDPLQSFVVTEPSNGSLTLNTDGSFSFTVPASVIAAGASITFTYRDRDGAMYSDDKTVTMYFIHVHITNPVFEVGSITQPADTDGNGNEFTFDGSNPGVLTIPVKATVTPDNQDVRDHVSLSTVAQVIGDSVENDPGFSYSNGQWEDVLTFTGLPDNNSDFGTKTLWVYAEPGDFDSVDYQVFFKRDATNHPGGDDTDPKTPSARSPNWYHYWSQVVSGGNMYYNSALSVLGRTPAMRLWSPTMKWAKDEIWIGPNASGEQHRQDGSNQLVDGIDLFANVVAHEGVHVQQIADADAQLGQYLGQPGYVAGWSWRVSPNNHTIPDGMGGLTSLDLVNNNTGAFQPDDIPDSWGPYSIEGAAENAEAIAENTYWQSDWADPGKQHANDQIDND